MRRLVARSILALALAALPGTSPSPAHAKTDPRIERLTPEEKQWLEEVAVLISKDERETFLDLEKDYQRDAFIERFWKVRDPYPDTARNELRDSWSERVLQARQEFGDLQEDRSRIFLLNGPPAVRLASKCSGSVWPIEVWVYPESQRIPEVLILVFVQHFGQGRFRIWSPAEGLAALIQFPPPNAGQAELLNEIANNCPRSDDMVGAIGAVLRKGTLDYTATLGRAEAPIQGPSREWVSTFNSYSTELPEGAKPLPATLEIAFPGRRQNRTVLQAAIGVPATAAGTAEYGGQKSYNFLLNGEVIRERKLFDTFRYKFDLPSAGVESASIPLVFERYLRPGDYTLIVKLEDLNGHAFFREQRAISVPSVESVMPPTAADEESAKLLAEANAALASGETTIRIVPPRGDLQVGLVRFDTLTTGETISEVQFHLDGKPILRKNRPPFSVELDLGDIPRTRTLGAVAFAADGKEVASDEIAVNASAHRFRVRLIEPRRGKRYEKSLRAEAAVDLPEDATLERVEFFLNETRVATLYQEPWSLPIPLPSSEQIAYVRAVAYLADGNSTEELVFVNAPENLEEVEVQFVEAYTSVLDRANHPVAGLQRSDFAVSEDGVAQELTRFEQVENLPVHAAILLDVSASMEPNLETARAAALQFFEQAVTPKDRAALITFNDHPTLAVKLTNRVGDLAAGLAGLKAERGTALWDSVVFSLFYFNGVKGQRALLLLSDGKDEGSRFTFDQTIDFARRAGVAIYAIGLDIRKLDFDARGPMKRLAEETGGRSFFIKDITELAGIYAEIQKELRSRYLLAYQSTNTTKDLKFRTIEVKVAKPGVEVKTMRGYYP
ncbi:MAG: VWA domain-containing protein [Thermoanaerobaculia bacterium]